MGIRNIQIATAQQTFSSNTGSPEWKDFYSDVFSISPAATVTAVPGMGTFQMWCEDTAVASCSIGVNYKQVGLDGWQGDKYNGFQNMPDVTHVQFVMQLRVQDGTVVGNFASSVFVFD